MWNVEKRVHVGRMWWNTWKNGFRFSVPSSTANVSRIDLIEARTNRAEKSKVDTTGIFRLVEGRKEEWLSGEITIPIEAKPKESTKAASRQFSTVRSCCSFRQITLASGLTIKPQMECVNRLSTGWFLAGSPTPIACNRKQNRFVKGKPNYAFARIQRFWYFSNDRLIENVRSEKVGSNFRSRFVATKHRS